MKRIIISLFIIIAMMLSVTSSFAATQNWNEAEALNHLGVFAGTSTTTFNPNLTATLDRTQGIVMAMKMFGKDHYIHDMSIAKVNETLARFSDQLYIPLWARPYIAWAVKHNMIKGTNKTELSPTEPLSGSAYCTMILRNLNYLITMENYAAAPVILQNAGLPNAKIVKYNRVQLTRGDAVGISINSLPAKFNTIPDPIEPTDIPEIEMRLLDYEISQSMFTIGYAKKYLEVFNIMPDTYWP